MKDNEKTREQLLHELTESRSQNTELKKSMTGSISAELAAEEARRYAESIVETVREPLLVLDEDLKIISANRSFYTTFKVTPAETVGSLIYDLGNKQWDIPKLRELLEEVLPEKQAFDGFEVTHDFQNIGHKIMLLNACRIYRKDIRAKMILLAIEDITEHKRLESLLIDSEEQYRRLFETANDGIVLLEKREGKITKANPAAEKLLGYTENESIGNKLQDIGVVLDTSDFQATMQNLNKSGILNYRNVKVETKSGQHIDTEIYLVDRAKLVQCNIRDITERKKEKEAFRKTEETYRLVVDSMADVITILDLNLRFTYVSPSIIRLRGYTAEEVMSQTMEQMMTPESLKVIARVFEEEMNLEAGSTADPARTRILELEEYRKDGSTVWLENHISTIRDNQKKLAGIITLSRDITERKRAEEALQASRAQLSNALEIAHLGHWEYDVADDLFTFNDQFYKLFHTAAEQVGGYTMHAAEYARRFLHPDDMYMVGEETRKAIETTDPHFNQQIEHRILYADGTVGYITARFFIVKDSHGRTVKTYGVNQDITERKLAEEKLKDTLESLTDALNTTIQVMVSAVEIRDPYTAGHQIRSADLASAIAMEMRLPQDKIDGIHMAGSIHDIGKLSIPAEILSKPTKLSEIEFSLIKEHAGKGYEILKDVESPWPLAEIVHQHHERMDGSGYPRNLKGEEICIEARILSVADVVEAMASHRPYRPGLGIDAALEEIEKNRGILYDNAAVDACLRLFREKSFQLAKA